MGVSRISLHPPLNSQDPLSIALIHRPLPNSCDFQIARPSRLVHLHARPGNHGCIIRTQVHRRRNNLQPLSEPAGIERASKDVHQELITRYSAGHDERAA